MISGKQQTTCLRDNSYCRTFKPVKLFLNTMSTDSILYIGRYSVNSFYPMSIELNFDISHNQMEPQLF